jgi:hypothetical protein
MVPGVDAWATDRPSYRAGTTSKPSNENGPERSQDVLIVLDRQGEGPRPVELPPSPGIVGYQAR